jgi:hypothetical protein
VLQLMLIVGVVGTSLLTFPAWVGAGLPGMLLGWVLLLDAGAAVVEGEAAA